MRERQLIESSVESDSTAMNEFLSGIPTMSNEDCWQIMAHYPDADSGGRVYFDPVKKLIVMESRTADKQIRVTCSLATFVKRITSITAENLWQEVGLNL